MASDAGSDSDLAVLRALVDRGRHAYRNRAIGCYVAAAAVLAITVAVAGADFYAQGPIVLVGILAITGGGFHLWYRSLGWDRHPALIALVRAPETIELARVEVASGRAALLPERQVTIASDRGSVMLTVGVADLPALGDAVAARCPRARLDGFPPGARPG